MTKKRRKPVSRGKTKAVRARDKDICQICFVAVTEGYGSVDHIIRITDGGTYELDNLRWSHKKCNNERHTLGPGTPEQKSKNRKKKLKTKARKRRRRGGNDPYKCAYCRRYPSLGHKLDCPLLSNRTAEELTFEQKLAEQKQDEDRMTEEK